MTNRDRIVAASFFAGAVLVVQWSWLAFHVLIKNEFVASLGQVKSLLLGFAEVSLFPALSFFAVICGINGAKREVALPARVFGLAGAGLIGLFVILGRTMDYLGYTPPGYVIAAWFTIVPGLAGYGLVRYLSSKVR